MKKHQNLKVLFLYFLTASLPYAHGQDLQKVGKSIQSRMDQSDPLRISGNLAARFRFHSISGIPPRSDPFLFRLAAQLNFDFLGVTAPFSAVFSDGDLTYRYPAYSFAGVSPSYKWATVHAGDRTLHFSPYTFSGHHFRGAGVELKPGKFYFAAFAGRLRRARPEEAGQIQRLDPVFKRMGWGFKMGVSDGKNALHLILFSARDHAPPADPTDTLTTPSPEANTVAGLQIKRQIGKLAAIDIDFARSALSRDIRSPETGSGTGVFLGKMAGLFQPRLSSGYHNAFKAAVRLTPKIGVFNLQFERIDPGYRTLGALFFNNDLENLTLGATLPFFKKKLSVTANGGLQRNNLSLQSNNAFNRLIGSLQANYASGDRVNLNLSYSNFSTTNRFTLVRTPFVEVDSVILVQTNQSASFSFSHLGGPEKTSATSMTLVYQNAFSIENDTLQKDLANTYYMGLLSHQLVAGSGRWRLGGSCLVNYTVAGDNRLLTVGPAAQATRSFGKQAFQVRSILSYALTYRGGDPVGQVFQGQLSAGIPLGPQQVLDGSLAFVHSRKVTAATGPPGFREWILSLGYTYRLNP